MFRQKRAGKDGVAFMTYTFRTMCDGADNWPQRFRNGKEPIVKMANDDRVTRIRDFLRRYGIDELPQFVNVLKGGMSLVGP